MHLSASFNIGRDDSAIRGAFIKEKAGISPGLRGLRILPGFMPAAGPFPPRLPASSAPPVPAPTTMLHAGRRSV